MVFKRLGQDLEALFRKLSKRSQIDQNEINELILDLQRALLTADVKVDLVFEMTETIRNEAANTTFRRGRRKNFIIKLVYGELVKILGGTPAPIRIKPGKSNVLLLVGIQGSGKTTTIGKLARFYKNKGYKVATVTTDTWRPGAYEQLLQLSKQVGVKCYGNPNESNTIKLAVKQTKKAIIEGHDIIIVDTAGRHKDEKELMIEMEKIESLLKPNEVMLVIDGTLGQQAFSQAEEFAKFTTIGSIIVTKLDGTAKGGGALSACAATGQPIRFIGIGEKIDDLECFDPKSFVSKLLGIPNIDEILRKIQEPGGEKPIIEIDKIRKFTLNDFYYILQNIKKVGKMKSILAMAGGANIPMALTDDAEKNMAQWEVILNSMTPAEKEAPKIIKKSRKRRIAIGSGTSYTTINRLLDQFSEMRKFMKRVLHNRRKKGGFGLPPRLS